MVLFFSMTSLFAAVVSLFMGSIVLFRNPKQALNRVFFLLCLLIAYWAFIEFQLRSAENFETADDFVPYLFLWPLPAAFALHFVLIFTRQRQLLRHKVVYALIYGPAIVIATIFLFSERFHGTPVLKFWGWTYNHENLIPYQIAVAIVVGMALLSTFFCLRFHLMQIDKTKRIQTGFVLLGLSIPTIAGVISEGLLPVLGFRIPELTTFGFAIGCGGFISYAILKYELFNLSPTAAAEEIISIMPDFFFLLDPEGRIISTNISLLERLDYGVKELAGEHVSKVFPEEEVLRQMLEASVRERSPEPLVDVETYLGTRSGGSVPISLSCTNIWDPKEKKIGSVCLARDISLRKQSEELLKESEERFRSVAESAMEGIICSDKNGRVIFWNAEAERLYGYSMAEMVGNNFVDLVVPERYRDGCRAGMMRAASGSPAKLSGQAFEAYAQAKDGHEFPVEISLSPWVTEDGLFITSMIRDISERKHAEERLLAQRDELTATNADLSTLYQISSIIEQETELTSMLEKVLDRITSQEIFIFERKGGVMLLEGETLELAACIGNSAAFMDSHPQIKMGQ